MIKNELGGWPILDPNYDENKETAFEKLVRFRKLESKPLFDFYIGPNPKDPSSWIIRVIWKYPSFVILINLKAQKFKIKKLQQASWFFNRKYYNNSKVIEAYKKHMLEVVKYLKPDVVNANEQIERMYNLEKELAMVQLDTDQKRNQTYENYTLTELNQVVPLVSSLNCRFFLFILLLNICYFQ